MRILIWPLSLAIVAAIAMPVTAAVIVPPTDVHPMHPSRLVQVLHQMPDSTAIEHLNAAGVEFLVLTLPAYPDSWSVSVLSQFHGTLQTIVDAPGAPDSMQVDSLNALPGLLTLTLHSYPDSFSAGNLARLKPTAVLVVFAPGYPDSFTAGTLGQIGHPLRLIVSSAYPDSWSISQLNGLPASVALTVNTATYPDSYTVSTLAGLTRPVALYIAAQAGPGSSWDAENLGQLGTNYTVFVGRQFTPGSVLEKILFGLGED